jgi:hypothetical protein
VGRLSGALQVCGLAEQDLDLALDPCADHRAGQEHGTTPAPCKLFDVHPFLDERHRRVTVVRFYGPGGHIDQSNDVVHLDSMQMWSNPLTMSARCVVQETGMLLHLMPSITP